MQILKAKQKILVHLASRQLRHFCHKKPRGWHQGPALARGGNPAAKRLDAFFHRNSA